MLFVIKLVFCTEVDVYELSGDDKMVVNNTFKQQSSDNFSICLYFMIDKFGDNDDVRILQIRQRYEKKTFFRILLKMSLESGWSTWPHIQPKVIVNGEYFETNSNIDVKKDVWTLMCLGIDWKYKKLGKDKDILFNFDKTTYV